MQTLDFDYEQPVDAVYAFVTDPARIEARLAAKGDQRIRVDVSDASGGKRITVVSDVTQELPGFAKKLFNPKNEVTQHITWTGAGAEKRATVDITVKGAPTTVRLEFTIAPRGEGARYTVRFSSTAKVPLIGKKLEAFVDEQTGAGLREEHAWNRAHMG